MTGAAPGSVTSVLIFCLELSVGTTGLSDCDFFCAVDNGFFELCF